MLWMPFQTLLFCFWIKVMKLVFITHHNAAKKVTTFNSILFQQMWGNIFFGWGLCCHQQARNPAVSKTFHHLLDHMIPLVQSLLPCIYSLWWAYRYFLSLSRGSLWATTMGLTGDVSVPVLKMFHPLSDAASTHTDVSLCTLKSCVIIWCGHLFLTKFYHYTLL